MHTFILIKQYSKLFPLLILALLSGCDESEKPIAGEKHMLHLDIVSLISENANARTLQIDASSFRLTIRDSKNELVIENQTFELNRFDDRFIPKSPISLSPGSYQIEELILYDADGNVSGLIPKKSSVLENLVQQPLPIDIDISSENINQVKLEVLGLGFGTSADYGYFGFSINEANTLNSGLLASYNFVGGSLIDQSGNGFDLTQIGGTTTNDRFGQSNNAYRFSGDDEYLKSDSFFDFERNQTFSMSLWLTPGEPPMFSEAIMSKMDTSNNLAPADNFRGWVLMKLSSDPGRLYFILRHTGGNGIDELRCSIALDDHLLQHWNHVVLTYDGSSNAEGVDMYLNGFLREKTIHFNTLKSTTITKAPFNIAARNNGNGDFKGDIDDIRFYNRVLLSKEVSALYLLSQ